MSITKEMLSDYKGDSKVFVETGTFHGKTTAMAVELGYDKVFSIECNEKFYQECSEKFKKNKNVKLVLGDSSEEIANIIKDVDSRITFWLDAHFMCMDPNQNLEDYPNGGEVPLIDELQQIKDHPIKNHTILIDDIPHLNDTTPREGGKYPATGTVETQLENLKNFVKTINPNYQFKLVDVPSVGQFMACTIEEE